MEILTVEQQIELAKKRFYEGTNKEIYTPSELLRYETSFCYGWLQTAYTILANELMDKKKNKKK